MMLTFGFVWAFCLLPLPLLVWWLAPPHKERTAALRVPFFRQVTSATQSAVSQGALVLPRSRVQMITAILCWLMLVTALARPERLGEPVVIEKSARDLILAVDISGSMDDRDMEAPDGTRKQRLQVVKDVIAGFIADREGDRIGLIVFGAKAYVQTPFTEDLDSVSELLNQTQVGMAGPNTAIGDAIGLSIRTFETSEVDQRLLILLSDGADTSSMMSPVNAAEIAAQAGVTIYTIGVGDPEGSGEERLDLGALEDIATRASGSFYYADDEKGLTEIYDRIDQSNPRVTDTQTFQPRDQIGYIPMSIALILGTFVLAFLHLTRRGRPA
jgi:Ca-activated chloride channel family protein